VDLWYFGLADKTTREPSDRGTVEPPLDAENAESGSVFALCAAPACKEPTSCGRAQHAFRSFHPPAPTHNSDSRVYIASMFRQFPSSKDIVKTILVFLVSLTIG
jgi:hypothetical protein